MKWKLLILIMTLTAMGNELIRVKYKARAPGKKAVRPVIKKISNYHTIIGRCKDGSSLGIYRNKITSDNELFYDCNKTQAIFEEIFPMPGINNDSLLDFGFILNREGVRQLYLIFSINDRLYHYEMIQELQDGSELAGPDNIPPLDIKYLEFYQLRDLNGDGTPEFINNIFKKKGVLTGWPDISDTLDVKKIYLESTESN